ncbi:putative two-component sensor histidine kinase [Fulvivirga imtechensis AK7]|uniref:histidine kinase n=1 Tax=Fulvivirga imtechensis AK7 TaxID=1237149 RepID=L8JP54_9BACT|nr:ATP-binding protein [Fulvivirga imtechensis]ELR69269.1 putative two-component sensor histidine kinase [Fulvivirga imtechensis AK7]
MASIKSSKIIFGIISGILLLISYLSYRSLNNLMDDAKWINHTNVILRELEKVISYVKDGVNAHRGYQLTSDSIYLEPYHNSKWMALSKINMVDSLTLVKVQHERADSLRNLVNRQYDIIEEFILRNKSKAFNEYEDSLLYIGHDNMRQIRRLVDRMSETEWEQLRLRTSQQDYASKVTPLLIFLSFVSAIIAVAYLFSQLYRSLRTKVATEQELEKNLMQLSEEVNEKIVAQESLQKVLHSSAGAIMFLRAIRDEADEIVDFEIVLTNRKGKLQADGTYLPTIGGRLLDFWQGARSAGLFDLYKQAVETGETQKKEIFYPYDGTNSWFDVSVVKLEDGCVATSTDITERKKDADIIKESQRKFEAIFNQTFQFIGLLEPSGRLLDANQTALEFAGISKADVAGKYLWEIPWWQPDGDPDIDLPDAVEKAATGAFVRYETQMKGTDEEILPIDFSLKPIKDDIGQVSLVIFEGRDLSEIKRAEEERLFIARLNLVIANAQSFDEALYQIFQRISERFQLDYNEVWLPEGDRLKMSEIHYSSNDAFHDLHQESLSLQLKKGEGFAGKILETFNGNYIEDLGQVGEQDFIRKERILEFGLTTAFGIPIIFNGDLVLISVFFSKHKVEKIAELVTAVQQISSSLGALLIKKKTQDEIEKNHIILAAAENMAKMGSWEWDLVTNKIIWSEGVYKIYKLHPAEFSPSQQAFMEFIFHEDYFDVEKTIQRAINDYRGFDMTFRIQLKDGTVRYVRSIGTPKFSDRGNLERLIGTLQDITLQKQAEYELLEKNEELKRSNENLEQFAYVASHDLQEPLRKIRAFGDRLVTKFETILGEQGQDYIARMQNAAERMQSLIDDLLKYSRVARNIEPFSKVDLNAVIEGVLIDLETRIKERKAKVVVDDLPSIIGDSMQLRQLFQNLISNAIKFTPKGEKPAITIRGEQLKGTVVKNKFDFNVNPGKHFVEININDNGIGFDAKYAERIFNIFERLHGRNEFKGTGIGLAISQKVVQNHNGLIKAQSEKGKGATFTIVLPINN